MRREFFKILHQEMGNNKNIIALTGDLGFGGFDKIQQDYPDRFINCGAAEQALLDTAVGLALQGKIPFAYSITPFLIYRPYETLRTYINHELINVKLIGSGRDKDYIDDGISHWAEDVKYIMDGLQNITTYYPNTKEQIQEIMTDMIQSNKPAFLSLKR